MAWITWLDVRDDLVSQQGYFPEGILSISTFWDTFQFIIKPNAESLVKQWLQETFSERYQPADNMFVLAVGTLSVQFKVVDDTELKDSELEQAYLPSFAKPRTIFSRPSALSNDIIALETPIVAFHSFKGGVGRTLQAMALAYGLSEAGKKVLLIDADVEAPGISFYINKPDRTISYADFLALLYGCSEQDDGTPNSDRVLNFIKDQLENMRQGDNFYLMPAHRTESQMHSLEIKPEHLISNFHPFVLTEQIGLLGKILGVDYVIVDLRAGLSEVSAGIILDPRVQMVMVTTLNPQSIDGTAILCELIAKNIQNLGEIQYLPIISINQIPDDITDEALSSAQDVLLVPFEETMEKGIDPLQIRILEYGYNQNLRVLSRSLSDALSQINNSGIVRHVLEGLKDTIEELSQ